MNAYAIMSADGLVCAGVYANLHAARAARREFSEPYLWGVEMVPITCPKCGATSRHSRFCDNHEENR